MGRPLRPTERRVLERLLAVDFAEVEYFRAQVPALTVRGGCTCGCGSLEFDVAKDQVARAPAQAWDGGPDVIVEGDQQSWLMLFQDGGYLTELEHVAGHGPRPDELDGATIAPESQVDDDWFV